jgi:hypothetical protein
MVFAPPSLWADPFFGRTGLTPEERNAMTNVLDKQLTGYAFVSLRSIGDQPGRNTPRYLSDWESLPETTYIPNWKFGLLNNQFLTITDPANVTVQHQVGGFTYANFIPFPSANVFYNSSVNPPYASLPYIAFDYLGRLTSGRDELIPLAQGSVLHARDPQTKRPLPNAPLADERPPGSSTNIGFNLIHVDWLTGRARLDRTLAR